VTEGFCKNEIHGHGYGSPVFGGDLEGVFV